MKTNKATQIALAGTGAVLASTGSEAYVAGIGLVATGEGSVNIWWNTHRPTNSGACTPEGSYRITGVLEDGTSYGPVVGDITLSSCDENGVSTRPAFASVTHAGKYCEVRSNGSWSSYWHRDTNSSGQQASLGYDASDPVLEVDNVIPDYYGGGVEDIRGDGAILCTDAGFEDSSTPWQGAEITGLSAGTYTVLYLCKRSDGANTCDTSSEAWKVLDQTASSDNNNQLPLVLSIEIEVEDRWNTDLDDGVPDDGQPGFEISAYRAMPVPVMGWLGSLALALITAVTAGLRLRRRAQA